MHFDMWIRGGIVVDGSGREPPRLADVGVIDDRIVAVGRMEGATAETVVDATGRVVCPGFIDVHIHSEVALLGGPHRYGAVQQGVTTHLTAPDGFGWAPLPPDRARQLWEATLFAHGHSDLDLDWPSVEAYLEIFARNTPANLVPQVPHCAVRVAVMGWDPRPATDDEVTRMKTITRQWLEAGATCLNLGLDYQPSAYSDLRELVELAKVTREYGGIYAAHVRYGILGEADAWRETMAIGRQADIPVHISHSSVTDLTAPLLDEARDTCDLTFESHLYPAGCTHLALMLPAWAQVGGPAGIRQRLRDPGARAGMRDHLHAAFTREISHGARAVFVATQTGRYDGKSIEEAAGDLPIGEFAVRVLEEEYPYALMIFHWGLPWGLSPAKSLDIVRATIQHPRMMVASDGVYNGNAGHPRGYGCFAQVLRVCVRERQLVSLNEAIYKMSGFPAERFRIKDRGLLRPGYGADLVIFDPETVADRATWEQPCLAPVGIDRVIVNGRTVVLDGLPTGGLPGRVLR